MPTGDRLIAFLLASVVLVLIPGPTVVFVVGRALALGRRAALGSVAGNSAGVVVLVTLVSFGLGTAVERSTAVYTVIRLLGAVYLVYLGVRTVLGRRRLADALGDAGAMSEGVLSEGVLSEGVLSEGVLSEGVLSEGAVSARAGRVYRQGFVVGLTNPKTLVFFAAVLPQFVDPSAGRAATQMLTLGLLYVLVAMVLDGAWGLAAGTARDWFARSPRRLSVLGGTGGLAMVGLGLGLAVTGRPER
jgi:threonine/homoserine/homoserine lactone efflux protein